MDDRTVAQEAGQVARDARTTKGLSDAESECLADLLKRDEAFGLLVTTQQQAALVDTDDHRVDELTAHLAAMAAGSAGRAIDRLVEARIEEAQEIVALAKAVDEPAPWGVMVDVYRAGYETIEALHGVDRAVLVADAGLAPTVAEDVLAGVAVQEGSA